MKKYLAWLTLLFCVILLPGCSGSSQVESDAVTEPGGEVIFEYEDNELSSGRGWFGGLPNGLRPMMMVNGKLYRWAGMSKEYHVLDSGEVYREGDTSTILPNGYVAVGTISSITEEVPSEEMQLRAAFEATGTIFTNEKTPEVIYVLMTTSWFDDCYMRFVSDDLHDNECISYQGKQYRFNINIDICEKIEEIPEECVLLGTLKYIGSDTIPLNDLETNRISDGYSKFLDGREVYANPDDHNVLYVYERQYVAQGDYPSWRVCRLWPE